MSDALEALDLVDRFIRTALGTYLPGCRAEIIAVSELLPEIRAALEQAEASTAEARAQALERLQDRSVVMINMMRGLIAVPRFRDLAFLAVSQEGFDPAQAKADLNDAIEAKRSREGG